MDIVLQIGTVPGTEDFSGSFFIYSLPKEHFIFNPFYLQC